MRTTTRDPEAHGTVARCASCSRPMPNPSDRAWVDRPGVGSVVVCTTCAEGSPVPAYSPTARALPAALFGLPDDAPPVYDGRVTEENALRDGAHNVRALRGEYGDTPAYGVPVSVSGCRDLRNPAAWPDAVRVVRGLAEEAARLRARWDRAQPLGCNCPRGGSGESLPALIVLANFGASLVALDAHRRVTPF